jgi:hypothetical protein
MTETCCHNKKNKFIFVFYVHVTVHRNKFLYNETNYLVGWFYYKETLLCLMETKTMLLSEVQISPTRT